MGIPKGIHFESIIRKYFIFLLIFCLSAGTEYPVLASQEQSEWSEMADQTISDQPQADQRTIRVLLVGNSYTKRNDLGGMIQKIGESRGVRMSVSTLAKGMASLSDFADQKSYLGKQLRRMLENEQWDYVILQEKRLRPLTDADGMKKDVKKLCRMIRKAGASPMLYIIWAPQTGYRDYRNYSKLVSDRKDYQRKLTAANKKAAKAAGAKLIPAGDALIRAETKLPRLKFEEKDGHHPNLKGSYVAACTIYSALTGKSAYGSGTYTAGISKKTAMQIQRIAWHTLSGNI